MSKFQQGGIEYPDYDGAESTNFNQVAEFTNDVYIYGKLYADIESSSITFSETTTFANVNVENIFLSGGIVGLSLIHI